MSRIKIILTIIGIYIFWLCLLPLILSNAVGLVCEKITANSDYNFQIKNPQVRLSVLPVGSLKADEIVFEMKDGSLKLKVNQPTLKIRLLPLLSGKVHINELNINNIDLYLVLLQELHIKKEILAEIQEKYIKFDNISLGEFKALFYRKDLEKPIEYKGEGFTYKRKNRYVKLKTNSTLNVSGNISKVVSNLYLPKNNDINKTIFEVEISNLNLAPFKAYFKDYLPKDLLEIKGLVDIYVNKGFLITELTNCGIIMSDSAKSMVLPSKMFVKSKFNITRNAINLEEVNIESDNIQALINGKINDYFGKTLPTLDLNVILNRAKVEDVAKLLPPFKVEEIDVYKLKKYRFYADALANFSIKGRLPEPNINGDIYINNGILIKPIPNTTKGATIKIGLNGRQISYDVVVPAGNLEKVWVKGTQELYNTKYAELTVKSTDSVNLKSAQDVVVPLHEILNFVLGPVPIMDINGTGNIDILVKGNRKNPHIWGLFNIKDGVVSLNDIKDLKIDKVDATLRFNDQNAFFSDFKAFLNEQKFSLSGNCDLYGKFDFDISADNQKTTTLYKAILKSDLLADINKHIPKIEILDGIVNFKLKVFGAVQDIQEIQLNQNVFAKGNIVLKNNDIAVQNVIVDDANGNINFDTASVDANINAMVDNLPLNIKAKIKNDYADVVLDIPKFNLNFLLNDKEISKKMYLPFVSLKGKYKGSLSRFIDDKEVKLDFNKFNVKALILTSPFDSKIKYSSGGVINVVNNKVIIKDVKGFINNEQNTFALDLNIENAFSKKIDLNGVLKLKTPDICSYNEILSSDVLPKNLKKYTKNYQFKEGALDLDVRIVNNKISLLTDLSKISFEYLPFEMPIEILNGSLSLKNNVLKLNKVNLLADKMPVLLDGEIKGVFNKQNFNLYINSKPQQEFIDKFINKNQIYPIKIKGDIVYWVKAKGVIDNFDIKTKIDMSKESSFYHFGATIGDNENAISVLLDTKIFDGNNCKIKEFSYDKIIDSQSGRQTKLNMLKAFGGVKILKDDLIFENLNIKTNHPTDARIFNIIFRKPNIKQGQFTSDLKINGKLSDAKVIGDFHIFETNIPFLDTSMKNIELIFRDKTIEFASKGDIMGNDIAFDGVMKNSFVLPYQIEKAYLYTKKMDLNRIVNKIKIAEVDDVKTFETLEKFDINSIVTKNFKIKADNIELRNIHAKDFEANTSLNKKGDFDVKDFSFNIAKGTLDGKFSYNLNNNDMSLNMNAESISANDITLALFDLNNQIHGDLTGKVNLSCNGKDFNSCMSTLGGSTIFNVKDGKMPKLGSLEYLLKAGNLVKGGLTGVSINGIIDLLAPSKTGNFSDIYGSIRIKDGIARNIEITTKGDDLSLFIGGTYNFATSIADMEVLGLLSRKISTMLGPIGNVSINTLFNVIPGVDLSKDSTILERINKIPGIELSSKSYRKFIAEIKGNINGDDYVTSFRWIN